MTDNQVSVLPDLVAGQLWLEISKAEEEILKSSTELMKGGYGEDPLPNGHPKATHDLRLFCDTLGDYARLLRRPTDLMGN